MPRKFILRSTLKVEAGERAGHDRRDCGGVREAAVRRLAAQEDAPRTAGRPVLAQVEGKRFSYVEFTPPAEPVEAAEAVVTPAAMPVE